MWVFLTKTQFAIATDGALISFVKLLLLSFYPDFWSETGFRESDGNFFSIIHRLVPLLCMGPSKWKECHLISFDILIINYCYYSSDKNSVRYFISMLLANV